MNRQRAKLKLKPEKISCVILVSFLMATLCLIPVPSGASDIPNDYNFGPGPAPVRSQGPGQSLRMTTMGVVPGMIKPGLSFNSAICEASIWGRTDDILLDFAVLEMRAGVTYGLSDRLGFGLGVDERRYIGGNFDQLTLTTHKVLGMGYDGRKQVPKYDHRVVRWDGDGSTVLFETREVDQINSLGINLGGHYTLTYGSDGFMPAVGATGIIRYTLEGPDGDVDNPLDWTVGLGFAKKLTETWYLYGYANYTKYELTKLITKGNPLEPLEFKEDTIDYMLAGGWQWSEKWATIFQYLRSEGAFEDFKQFSDPSNEIDITFKWQAGEKDVLQFTMIENFGTHENSPDFGLQVAYAHHFGN